jgi:hypothetical protein
MGKSKRILWVVAVLALAGGCFSVPAPADESALPSPPTLAQKNIASARAAGSARNYAANPQLSPNPATAAAPPAVAPRLNPCTNPDPAYACVPWAYYH